MNFLRTAIENLNYEESELKSELRKLKGFSPSCWQQYCVNRQIEVKSPKFSLFSKANAINNFSKYPTYLYSYNLSKKLILPSHPLITFLSKLTTELCIWVWLIWVFRKSLYKNVLIWVINSEKKYHQLFQNYWTNIFKIKFPTFKWYSI